MSKKSIFFKGWCFLLSLLITGGTIQLLTAQSLSISVDSLGVEGDVSNNSFEIVAHSDIINNTSDSFLIVWEKTKQSLDSDWDGVAVCDKNKCYRHTVDSQAFMALPSDSFRFDVHFYHNDSAGKGSVNLKIYAKKDSANLNDEAIYTAKLTDTSTVSTLNSPVRNNIITLSPNPATKRITLFTPRINIKQVRLFNVLGKQVKRWSSSNNKPLHSYDISALPEGMYFIRVRNEKEGVIFTESLVIN